MRHPNRLAATPERRRVTGNFRSCFSILFCGVLLNALAQLGLKAATRVSGPLIAGDAGFWQRALRTSSSRLSGYCRCSRSRWARASS